MASAADYKLSITPVKVTDIPPISTLLAQGRDVINSTPSWKQGKTFPGGVHSFSRARIGDDVAAWHCRVSEHGADEATFDVLWGALSVNKGEKEVFYVEEVKKATLISQIAPGQAIWSMFYRFPPPVSPRVFTVLQVVEYVEGPRREGIIVSIPVDLTPDPELLAKEEKGTYGHYASVERVLELDDGKVEWRMATTSSAGGRIPQFMTERSIASSIARDVPGLLKWLREHKEKPAEGAPATTTDTHVESAPQEEVGTAS